MKSEESSMRILRWCASIEIKLHGICQDSLSTKFIGIFHHTKCFRSIPRANYCWKLKLALQLTAAKSLLTKTLNCFQWKLFIETIISNRIGLQSLEFTERIWRIWLFKRLIVQVRLVKSFWSTRILRMGDFLERKNRSLTGVWTNSKQIEHQSQIETFRPLTPQQHSIEFESRYRSSKCIKLQLAVCSLLFATWTELLEPLDRNSIIVIQDQWKGPNTCYLH